jgi:hypothetical protein
LTVRPGRASLRVTQRSRAGLLGTNTLLWSGIDVDIPTEPTHSKCSPNGVRDAVLAAFQGNADIIILSRKYSEMKLTDLQGARTTLHQLHLATLVDEQKSRHLERSEGFLYSNHLK